MIDRCQQREIQWRKRCENEIESNVQTRQIKTIAFRLICNFVYYTVSSLNITSLLCSHLFLTTSCWKEITEWKKNRATKNHSVCRCDKCEMRIFFLSIEQLRMDPFFHIVLWFYIAKMLMRWIEGRTWQESRKHRINCRAHCIEVKKKMR